MYRKILLAYDGSSLSAEVLREGAELAALCKAELYVLSVADISGAVTLAEAVVEPDLQGAEQAMEQALRALRSTGLTAAGSVRLGNPATEIAACAREMRADLVVVGHTGKGMLARWLQGSVGAMLRDHLACSLLVMIPRKSSDTTASVEQSDLES